MDGYRTAAWLGRLVVAFACVGCLGDPPQLPPPAGSGSETGSTDGGTAGQTSGAEGTTEGRPEDSSGSADGPGQTTGVVDPGDCCSPHDEPGCADPMVQDCVCQLESQCCDESWSDLCVSQVENLGCGSCGTTTTPCCEPHAGCEDPGIYECVCSIYPSCCDEDWGLYCVTVGVTECGVDCRPIEGPCCEPGMQFGCDDYAALRCVCDVIPECCSMPWDVRCAELAAAECMAC